MYGKEVPMSPDDHYADLKRIIAANMGKARRISVIMPMLYEGRQHKRSSRESLDCAIMLQELINMGVTNIITFDAHDPRVQNAIPLSGFDDVRPSYQMIKALVRAVPDVQLNKESLMIISPDEGAMGRCMYFSSVLGLDIGMFYKRRNYSVVVNGRNPIEAHEYLGKDLTGMDVIVVDDMISSGESMLDVAAQLKQKGAKRIFAFSTFGLFTSGPDKFDKAYKDGIIDRVFTTNLTYTTPEVLSREWHVEVNMCKYVAYIIDTLNHDDTLSELLNPVKRIHKLVEKHKKDQETQVQMKFDN
jgi:ribose-phosphate pyrophosphokinase